MIDGTSVYESRLNMGEQLAHSSLLAIMGRMSAYTGKTITWDEVVESKETWSAIDVNSLDWNSKIPVPEVA